MAHFIDNNISTNNAEKPVSSTSTTVQEIATNEEIKKVINSEHEILFIKKLLIFIYVKGGILLF